MQEARIWINAISVHRSRSQQVPGECFIANQRLVGAPEDQEARSGPEQRGD